MTDQPDAKLPPDWYQRIQLDNTIDECPGIYEWRIEGIGLYIGKFGRIRRPTREYQRNINRLLNGKSYRLGDADRFRLIHHALADAHRKGIRITLTILENVCDPNARSLRERAWIDRRRAEMTTGGLSVLNST